MTTTKQTAERQTLIAQLADFPELLAQTLEQLSPENLDTPYRAGGWTSRQVVHHLFDSHANAYIRMKLIATEDTPTLKTYDEKTWAETADYRLPVEVSLNILRGLHKRWATWLESECDNENFWQRAGNHPENGRMTLDDLLKLYVAHGEKHIGHIRQVEAEVRD